MTTKELIKAEIDSLPEKDLDELYRLIREFAESRTKTTGRTFMSKLRDIQIDAPEDFAANLDDHMSGEKGGN